MKHRIGIVEDISPYKLLEIIEKIDGKKRLRGMRRV